MGISTDTLQNGLRSFPGLAHRMEQVGRRGNVLFVNDSKGTNADAAAHALSSFADIFWIAGGKPKQGGITGLTEYFPRIRKAYLIGEAAQEFAGTLGERVPHEISETLDVAVANAARDAEASRVSPRPNLPYRQHGGHGDISCGTPSPSVHNCGAGFRDRMGLQYGGTGEKFPVMPPTSAFLCHPQCRKCRHRTTPCATTSASP